MSIDPDDTPITPDVVTQGSGLAEDPFDTDGDPTAAIDPLAALLGGGNGGSGGLDFGALMEQASQMQTQMLAAQQHAAETIVEGVAGGGAVRISVTGGLDFESVTIDPKAVDPDDVDMLQDLVLAALRDAVEQINGLQHGSIDLGGLDLGGLLGGN